jgi:hypothetical protein
MQHVEDWQKGPGRACQPVGCVNDEDVEASRPGVRDRGPESRTMGVGAWGSVRELSDQTPPMAVNDCLQAVALSSK